MTVKLANYSVNELISDNGHTLIFSGTSNADKSKVVIKVLKTEYPTPEENLRFKHEFEIMKSLHNIPNVVHAYSLEKYQHSYALIIEKVDGTSLANTLSEKRFTLKEFLKLAILTTKTLGNIHQCNIIHKDIKPANILYDTEKNEIKITDFSLAADIPKEKLSLVYPDLLEGTLAYISPEQTGRMNRGIDYRSDYYSLGVTFYEILTGKLPFPSKDPMELIHGHIAVVPPTPRDVNPSIPEIVSNIIMKLLEKTVEARYQSAPGLLGDLKKCLDQLVNNGHTSLFPLGKHEIYNQFQIPEKLYGRDNEIKLLLTSYEHVKKGNVELVCLDGHSGIGKTSLVHEFYKNIPEKGGYFISGKFEQFKHNIPYSAFTQVFDELIKNILMEREEKIAVFRSKILNAVGENGEAIISIIPALEKVIGKQPSMQQLGLLETQNRFQRVFLNFTQTLIGFYHPLVIFLDDLQWADSPSLKMLEILLTNPDYRNLFIIGAYRSNEVNSIHPLMIQINELKKRNVICNFISLNPLNLTDVNELISDTLYQDNTITHDLAQLCYEKTGGNPFFLTQLLQTLYEANLIKFDLDRGCWIWYLDKIKEKNITDNVVQLMIDKIQKFLPETQAVIKFASCIGNKFDVDLLSAICHESREAIVNHLQEAQRQGLILNCELNHTKTYMFAHDRIQQAAHSLIDENESCDIHVKLGTLLLEATPAAKLDEVIFDIVNHFNIGLDSAANTLTDNSKKKIAELNLRVCKLAKNAVAFEPALTYAKYGLLCLTEDAWQLDYALALELYVEASDVAYLNAKFDLVEMYSKIGLKHTKDVFDELEFIKIKVASYVTQLKIDLAIETIRNSLATLGVYIPKKVKFIHILLAVIKIKWLLFGKKIPDLLKLPEMTDPIKKATMTLLFIAITSAAVSNLKLFALLTCIGVILSIRYGNNLQWSADAYVAYGMITSGTLGDIEGGYQFGEMAINLVEKTHADGERAQVLFGNYGFLKPWKEKLQNLPPKLEESYHIGIRYGDLVYGHYCLASYGLISYFAGMPLKEIRPKIEAFYKRLKSLKQDHAFNNLAPIYQSILNLSEKQVQPDVLRGTACDETIIFQKHKAAGSHYGFFVFYVTKLAISYLFEKYDNAMKSVHQADLYVTAAGASPLIAAFYFYKSLTLLALYASSTAKDKRKIIKIIKINQKKMQKWAFFAPMNYSHKYFLVQAELARIQGRVVLAEELYEQAIELAKQNDFLNEEALANELAAKFYLLQAKEKISKIYMQAARHCYLIWGADTKVEQIDLTYPHLLENKFYNVSSVIDSASITSQQLDISTIQKASQLISGTIVLSDLLKKLMGIMIENAGAQRSLLLLNNSGEYVIEAEGCINKQEEKILQSIPVSKDILPTSIISYVVRTHEPVILENASRVGQFKLDAYVVKGKLKSILCIPLLNQGALSGVIYLENNIIEGAFTKNHIAILNVLSSQIAISIDNARLYSGTLEFNKKLIALNKAYERFVPRDFLRLLDKESILDVVLGDNVKKNMTVLFADVRNFTTLSEKMTPQENFTFINSFLGQMEPVITNHKGFIDKYIGDAIMALFPNSADDAIQCAIEMQHVLGAGNHQRKSKGNVPIEIGIGINSGLLMLGTIGGENRMDGTVISDTVNVASRIETLTKTYKASILITDSTYKQLINPSLYNIRFIDELSVKGKTEKTTIYEVICMNDSMKELTNLNKGKT